MLLYLQHLQAQLEDLTKSNQLFMIFQNDQHFWLQTFIKAKLEVQPKYIQSGPSLTGDH